MAIQSTARGFRYPTNDEAPDIQRDLGNLAGDCDGQFIQSLANARPAAGKVGRRHLATDTGQESLDIGPFWIDTANPDNAGLERSSTGLLRLKDGGVTSAKVASTLKPSLGAGTGTEALRALGTTAGTAAAGNDSRIVARAVDSLTENLRIVRGRISTSGLLLDGSGASITHSVTGVYVITFDTAFNASDWPTVVVTPYSQPAQAQVASLSSAAATINTYTRDGVDAQDINFLFIAVGPR